MSQPMDQLTEAPSSTEPEVKTHILPDGVKLTPSVLTTVSTTDPPDDKPYNDDEQNADYLEHLDANMKPSGEEIPRVEKLDLQGSDFTSIQQDKSPITTDNICQLSPRTPVAPPNDSFLQTPAADSSRRRNDEASLFVVERRKVLQLLRWLKKMFPLWASLTAETSISNSTLTNNYRYHWDMVLNAKQRDELSVYADVLNELLRIKQTRPDIFPFSQFLDEDRICGTGDQSHALAVGANLLTPLVNGEEELVEAIWETLDSLDYLRARESLNFVSFSSSVEKFSSVVSSRLQEIQTSRPPPEEISRVLSSLYKHSISTLLQDLYSAGEEKSALQRLEKELTASEIGESKPKEEVKANESPAVENRKRRPNISIADDPRHRKSHRPFVHPKFTPSPPLQRRPSVPHPVVALPHPGQSVVLPKRYVHTPHIPLSMRSSRSPLLAPGSLPSTLMCVSPPRSLQAEVDERPKSGLPGVHWATRPRGWVASWKEEGKRNVKYFPVSHFEGNVERARLAAVQFKNLKVQLARSASCSPLIRPGRADVASPIVHPSGVKEELDGSTSTKEMTNWQKASRELEEYPSVEIRQTKVENPAN